MDFLSGAGSLTCEGEVNMHIYRVREWGMSAREVEETKKEERKACEVLYEQRIESTEPQMVKSTLIFNSLMPQCQLPKNL